MASSGKIEYSKRYKTKHVGVYYRYGKRRVLSNGKPDKCFDIHYKNGNRYIFEKVGWVSEKYTLDDAIALRAKRVKALRHPELTEPSSLKKPTVCSIWEIYKEKWLPNVKRPVKYISMYEKYIGPVFGAKKINKISALDIQEFKNNLLKTPIDREPFTLLKPCTVKMILKFFKAILIKAIEWELIESKDNPIGKIEMKDCDSKRERFLTPQEAEKLLEACQFVSCTTYYVALVSLYSGMRLGEILTLKGQNVDIESGVIYLNGKTGRRTAFISEHIKFVFEKLMPDDPSDFLFCDTKGLPIKSTSFSSDFSKIINAIGLNKGITDDVQKIVFHTLRHTFCSWLAIKGVPLYTIGQLVGHSSTDMTQRYAKLSPDSKRDALIHIEQTMRNI